MQSRQGFRLRQTLTPAGVQRAGRIGSYALIAALVAIIEAPSGGQPMGVMAVSDTHFWQELATDFLMGLFHGASPVAGHSSTWKKWGRRVWEKNCRALTHNTAAGLHTPCRATGVWARFGWLPCGLVYQALLGGQHCSQPCLYSGTDIWFFFGPWHLAPLLLARVFAARWVRGLQATGCFRKIQRIR